MTDAYGAAGIGGKLIFSVPGGAAAGLYATDGGMPVLLAAATGISSGFDSPGPLAGNGRAYFRATDPQNGPTLWTTDGTPAGTFSVAGRASDGHSPTVQPVAELSPGKWLMRDIDPGDLSSTLYTLDTAGRRQTLGQFDHFSDLSSPRGFGDNSLALPGNGPSTVIGGKVYFGYHTDVHSSELWATDGTPGGTTRIKGAYNDAWQGWVAGQFAGRALLAERSSATAGYLLTDGTDAGQVAVPRPASWQGGNALPDYLGNLSPSAAYPKGLMVFAEWHDGYGVYVTDGTPGGTHSVDTTGVPKNTLLNFIDPSGRATIVKPDAAVLNGSLYFAGPRVGEVRPEPWKLDLAAAPVTPPVRPPVTATVTVNGGDKQRSTVTKITVAFDREVLLTPGAFELRNQLTGKLIPLTPTSPKIGGATVLDFAFAGPPGGLADGTYTFTIRAAKVTAVGGGTLAADSVTTVTRLFGDLDGDGRYDRASRWMLHERLGAKRGGAKYLAAFDVDSDGTIGAAELAVVRNWGK